jgi:hypothetical protein
MVVENLDADRGALRVFGQIAAPGFFLAFPVANLHHRQINIQVPSQNRPVFKVTHDHYFPQLLQDLAALATMENLEINFKRSGRRGFYHRGSPLRSRSLSLC